MFLAIKADKGEVQPFEYLPAGAITPKAGLALKQSSGLLAVASGTDKPTYICQREEGAAVTSGTVIPVIRVNEDIIFETSFTADATSINIGDKVTISSDGLGVTATTTSGVAEIVYKDGSASGSMCRVRFSD